MSQDAVLNQRKSDYEVRIGRAAKRIEIATRNNFLGDTEFTDQSMEDRDAIEERYTELRSEYDHRSARARANREFIKHVINELVRVESQRLSMERRKKAFALIRPVEAPEPPQAEFNI